MVAFYIKKLRSVSCLFHRAGWEQPQMFTLSSSRRSNSPWSPFQFWLRHVCAFLAKSVVRNSFDPKWNPQRQGHSGPRVLLAFQSRMIWRVFPIRSSHLLFGVDPGLPRVGFMDLERFPVHLYLAAVGRVAHSRLAKPKAIPGTQVSCLFDGVRVTWTVPRDSTFVHWSCDLVPCDRTSSPLYNLRSFPSQPTTRLP